MEQGAPQPEITTQPGAAPLRQLRLLRWRLHRLWCLPESYRVFTPAFAGLFLLTVISLGLTAASWVMVRLLPNQELVAQMVGKFPHGIWDFLQQIPMLLEKTEPSSIAVAGALVAQDAYRITYAFGAASIFCLLLLLAAFIRRW